MIMYLHYDYMENEGIYFKIKIQDSCDGMFSPLHCLDNMARYSVELTESNSANLDIFHFEN